MLRTPQLPSNYHNLLMEAKLRAHKKEQRILQQPEIEEWPSEFGAIVIPHCHETYPWLENVKEARILTMISAAKAKYEESTVMEQANVNPCRSRPASRSLQDVCLRPQ